MYSRKISSRRVSRAEFMKMTPAQRQAKSKAVNRSKRVTRSIESKNNYRAPTAPVGNSVHQTQLTKNPLFPIRSFQRGQLYYEGFINLAPTIGSLQIYNFSANDLYDPNRTGTGHQPMGFDQMMNLYEQFTVVRSHIKITACNYGGDQARIAVYLNPDTSASTITAVMENGLLETKVLAGSGTDAGQHRVKSLELTCDVPKYFGKTYDAILADPQMYGTIASSPGEQVYFTIAVWDPFNASGDCQVGLDVTISYDSMYWEPKKLTSS